MMCRLLAILAGLSVAVTGATASESQDTRRWEFRVLLDGREIGSHEFTLEERKNERRLRSEASFDVKFLFFTAYRYRHNDTEIWSDGCLRELDATTVTNGKELSVSGSQQSDAFVVERDGTTETLPCCVMTFAYWNPDFLNESHLLNPQTGKYLPVEVRKLPPEAFEVRGRTVTADRYRVTARDIDLELWYSPDNRWLALESSARGGRTLRYELI